MASTVLTYISNILKTGKNLIFSDANNRLPLAVEATLPAAVGRNAKNGVAATNSDGVPVDISGRPMAAVADVSASLTDIASIATGAATTAGQAVAATVGRVLGVNGSVSGVLWVPIAAPTAADMAALQVPNRTLVVYPGA